MDQEKELRTEESVDGVMFYASVDGVLPIPRDPAAVHSGLFLRREGGQWRAVVVWSRQQALDELLQPGAGNSSASWQDAVEQVGQCMLPPESSAAPVVLPPPAVATLVRLLRHFHAQPELLPGEFQIIAPRDGVVQGEYFPETPDEAGALCWRTEDRRMLFALFFSRAQGRQLAEAVESADDAFLGRLGKCALPDECATSAVELVASFFLGSVLMHYANGMLITTPPD
jgi:hypothetical protein